MNPNPISRECSGKEDEYDKRIIRDREVKRREKRLELGFQTCSSSQVEQQEDLN